MNLQRTLEQYANCTASGVVGGSRAQMMYFVEDAKKDIATLATALAAKDAELAKLSAQAEWLKARLAFLQLPSKQHHRRDEWLVECGMPTGGSDAS